MFFFLFLTILGATSYSTSHEAYLKAVEKSKLLMDQMKGAVEKLRKDADGFRKEGGKEMSLLEHTNKKQHETFQQIGEAFNKKLDAILRTLPQPPTSLLQGVTAATASAEHGKILSTQELEGLKQNLQTAMDRLKTKFHLSG